MQRLRLKALPLRAESSTAGRPALAMAERTLSYLPASSFRACSFAGRGMRAFIRRERRSRHHMRKLRDVTPSRPSHRSGESVSRTGTDFQRRGNLVGRNAAARRVAAAGTRLWRGGPGSFARPCRSAREVNAWPAGASGRLHWQVDQITGSITAEVARGARMRRLSSAVLDERQCQWPGWSRALRWLCDRSPTMTLRHTGPFRKALRQLRVGTANTKARGA